MSNKIIIKVKTGSVEEVFTNIKDEVVVEIMDLDSIAFDAQSEDVQKVDRLSKEVKSRKFKKVFRS